MPARPSRGRPMPPKPRRKPLSRAAKWTIGGLLGAAALGGAAWWKFSPKPKPVNPVTPNDTRPVEGPRTNGRTPITGNGGTRTPITSNERPMTAEQRAQLQKRREFREKMAITRMKRLPPFDPNEKSRFYSEADSKKFVEQYFENRNMRMGALTPTREQKPGNVFELTYAWRDASGRTHTGRMFGVHEEGGMVTLPGPMTGTPEWKLYGKGIQTTMDNLLDILNKSYPTVWSGNYESQ